MPTTTSVSSTGSRDTFGDGPSRTSYMKQWDPNPSQEIDALFPDWEFRADPRKQTGWMGYEINVQILGPPDDSLELTASYVMSSTILAHLSPAARFEAVRLLMELWNRDQAPIGDNLDPEQTFYGHLGNWLKGIGPSSDPNVIFSHPSFKAIVGMGSGAIPFLDREMAARDFPLSSAVQEITGAQSSPEAVVGKKHGILRRMRKAFGW
jgi:hypothetical protein